MLVRPDRTDGDRAAEVPAGRKFREALDRRAEWVEAFIILATLAAGFIVLGYLASYFADYFHLILIFFFGWMLAFLISPPADWLQRKMRRLPRPVAVLGVIMPVIVIGSLVMVRVAISLTDSFVAFAAALPEVAAHPPQFVADIQARLSSAGVTIDLESTVRTVVDNLSGVLSDMAGSAFGGVFSAFGLFIDALLVVSLAVFIAIDRDKLMRFGIELTPPARREEMLEFRRGVGAAFAGFIRSQLILGLVYGIWAVLVSLILGLPYWPATAALTAVIMAIPIYGPYVSWLPPVIAAALGNPDLILITAVLMLVGWFIDENILAPVIRSGALEINPIVVVFAFLLGGQLAGAIGAVVAIPLAAVVQAFVMKYLEQYRIEHGWTETAADPSPPEGGAGTGSPADSAAET